jgi:hypothetical protein
MKIEALLNRANAAFSSLAKFITPTCKATSTAMRMFLLAAAVVFVSSSAFAQAQFQTDHFKCYMPDAATPITTATVNLVDQFGAQPNVKVKNIFRFCNPTVKNHGGVITPIMNPDAHLTLHRAGPQTLVTREVKIRNQFGDQTLITQRALYLAVPTQKEPHGPAFNLDHFNCYTVSDGPAIKVPVVLTDQWFTSTHKVARPKLFCNPVQKTHNGVVTPIIHPNDHLTCYAITPVPFSKDVILHNQFGNPVFSSQRADMLCVPTDKLAWKVVVP